MLIILKSSAGLNTALNAFCLRLNTGIKKIKCSLGRAEPGRAVPPRGWYNKYRRNVDQLRVEPGGARDLIGCDARIVNRWTGGQAAPATTQSSTQAVDFKLTGTVKRFVAVLAALLVLFYKCFMLF